MKASNLKSFALGFGIAIAALGLYALAATLSRRDGSGCSEFWSHQFIQG
jgi:hypothetical protein